MGMFDAFESKDVVDDAVYARRVSKLRADLLDAQYDVLEKKAFPVIVLVNGVEGTGKGETVNLLNEWMDSRHIRAVAFDAPNEEERARPPMWRFWNALPEKGKLGVFFGSWYSEPIIKRAERHISERDLERHVERISAFEELLQKDGALIVKIWFHLEKHALKKRLHSLEKKKLTRWRVTPQEWHRFELYDRYVETSEQMLRRTSSVPWHVVNGFDANKRALDVGELLLHAMKQRLAEHEAHEKNRAENAQKSAKSSSAGSASKSGKNAKTENPDDAFQSEHVSILQSLTFEKKIEKEDYSEALAEEQRALNLLSRKSKFQNHRSCVLVFEGNDAAGKGGAVRRVTTALDARQVHVIPIAAPTREDKLHPYLWRFWRHVPKRGTFTIFDRSWYGRVLVERVEGFATSDEWQRAYHEIEAFEHELTESGVVVVKFWLAVTQEEQLKRFNEREKMRFKRFKITDEDWRNRKQWAKYEVSASDMIAKTSSVSPWNVIEANDKHLARVKVLRAINKAIDRSIPR